MSHSIFAYLTANSAVANAIAALASAVIAAVALIVSGISLWVARSSLQHQQRHGVLSVRPLPMVWGGDYEDRLSVKLVNNGSGPLIVTKLQVSNKNEENQALINLMPELPVGFFWTTFIGPIASPRAILPGHEVVLIQLDGAISNEAFARIRDACRDRLRHVKVTVEYTDVYSTPFAPYFRELAWFGRAGLTAYSQQGGR